MKGTPHRAGANSNSNTYNVLTPIKTINGVALRLQGQYLAELVRPTLQRPTTQILEREFALKLINPGALLAFFALCSASAGAAATSHITLEVDARDIIQGIQHAHLFNLSMQAL